jgi:hypothetical protein
MKSLALEADCGEWLAQPLLKMNNSANAQYCTIKTSLQLSILV